jgi:hypothetical protein
MLSLSRRKKKKQEAIMTYQEAKEKLGNRTSRKLANNTYLILDGQNIAVRLHATNVLTFTPQGTVIYNSGGWQTRTTKERMNAYGQAFICQRSGSWLIGGNPYQDGIELNAATGAPIQAVA